MSTVHTRYTVGPWDMSDRYVHDGPSMSMVHTRLIQIHHESMGHVRQVCLWWSKYVHGTYQVGPSMSMVHTRLVQVHYRSMAVQVCPQYIPGWSRYTVGP